MKINIRSNNMQLNSNNLNSSNLINLNEMFQNTIRNKISPSEYFNNMTEYCVNVVLV